MSTRSILALELCLKLEPQLVEQLRRLLTLQTERLSFQQKWYQWTTAASALRAHRGSWVRGCWDFWDDDGKARADFNMWVQGLLTEEGARSQPSGVGDPYRGEPRYMTFTMAALMVQGTAAERQVAQLCEIAEPYLWHAATFDRVLEGVRYLNFASVEGSTLYLIPNDVDWGLTGADLEHPKFEYLRPIV